jgi:hypothetical protein
MDPNAETGKIKVLLKDWRLKDLALKKQTPYFVLVSVWKQHRSIETTSMQFHT